MPRRKAATARQNRETRDIGLARVRAGHLPACPKLNGKPLLVVVQRAWTTFWRGDVAGLVADADLPALERLFGMYDQRERMARVAAVEPFTTGSTGQIVAHPALAQVASLDGRIQTLEDRFGITPAARLKLGIVLGAAAKSLEDLNASFTNAGADEGEEADEDPRLRAIEGHATG